MGQWKAGDVVMLKSAGPKMTVGSVKEDGRVICEWFDEKNSPQIRAFSADVLMSPPESGSRTIRRGG